MLSYIRNLYINTFLETEQESQEFIRLNGKTQDSRLMTICITVAVSLSLIHYFSDVNFTAGFLHSLGAHSLSGVFEKRMFSGDRAQLWRLGWWAGLILFFYFVIPLLLIKYVFREQLSSYGLKLTGAFRDIRLYAAMLCVMVPLVLFFSSTKSFQARYPFYELQAGEPLYPWFMLWELIYFLQFFALEFFFRGFILHGLKHRFGFYSVFVMLIPYCMIHFGKPLPETLAAIIAGIVLGVLSLKSRSVWLGVLIHFSVALTMDLCALWQKGLL